MRRDSCVDFGAVYILFVCLLNFPLRFLPSLLSSFFMLSSLHISLLTHLLLTYLRNYTPSRIRYQAVCRRRRTNVALVFFVFLCCSMFCYDSRLLFCVCFRSSVLSQEIGWEDRLRNDLFCVG